MITRFAPSPTGPLHLGHAYSAMLAHGMAHAAGGTFLLRHEDTDFERSKDHWIAQVEDDLHWLGLSWPEPALRQSGHLARYARALDRLEALGVLYPCSCTRGDIKAALSAPQEGYLPGPYPGTCRGRPMSDRREGDAIRLHLSKALALVGPVTFTETGAAHRGVHTLEADTLSRVSGDVIVGRKDGVVAYFLASALDDKHEGITEVIRGEDLFNFTGIQALILALLGHAPPRYHHHRLIRDDAGKRLAKRDDARAIATYRAEGLSPGDIRAMVGL
ncbi:MAG: tRNA glutamyl-Q(34) synthetase GluQRS [Pseudomonadota bacterium]